jgi:CheY-like chemotaxis protein
MLRVQKSATAHRKAGKSIHALPVAVVDDDLSDQLLLQRILDQIRGFVCVGCFSSGEAALEGIPRSGAKLVLMDLRFPGMSGLECARRLKLVHRQPQR